MSTGTEAGYENAGSERIDIFREVTVVLTFVRGGPRVLIVRARSGEWDEFLQERLQAIPYSTRDALDIAGEGQTVFLCTGGEGRLRRSRVYFSPIQADDLLCRVLNEKPTVVDRIIPVPRMIVFRYFGDYRKIFDQMLMEFQGVRGKLRHVMRKSSDLGAAVCFTDQSLNRPLRVSDFEDDVLYVRQPFESIFTILRNRGLDYFNEGLAQKEWNDVEIRMYDMEGLYDLHIRRMRIVMNALEAGLILGEGWGKDYAHILMPVRVYRIRILTFLSHEELKRIVMGLEYASNGDRFLDLDLYANKKKIGWGDVMKERRGNRQTVGMERQKDLVSMLIPSEWSRLLEIENEIRARSTSANQREES